jgi:CDP-paratose 2-epimerase
MTLQSASGDLTLVTGGAGFIGTNLAARLLEQGRQVVVFDNLSRPGVDRNLVWLRERYGDRVRLELGDIRDAAAVRAAVAGATQVFHFAAQVAVTTSLVDPIEDFEVNAGGTMNLLEAIRACPTPPPLVFTSTNKVYGDLEDVRLAEHETRYEPTDEALRSTGIGETQRLDFHSPYGCSKGSADQYAIDYARTYGLEAVVFRMSCIYGEHQCGNEDQGWVAHFLIRAIEHQPIILYGNGKQVRDVLFADDLIDALLLAQERMGRLHAQAFNIGGGPGNTVSLLELLDLIAELAGEHPRVSYGGWRPADQRYYVSDIRRFGRATGWGPRVDVREGVARLYRWLMEQHGEPAIERTGQELPASSGAAR